MFPLADARGRVLGFGARAMRDDQRPKYMNTPEGELYHKRRQLFGIDRARAAVAKARQVIVVEGYTDVLALHAGGVRAVGGDHGHRAHARAVRRAGARRRARTARSCWRSTPTAPGLDAMLRAARAAEEKRIDLMVVELPEGKDPADLVAEGGAEAFTRLLDRAISVPEFQTRRVLAEADLEHAARPRPRARRPPPDPRGRPPPRNPGPPRALRGRQARRSGRYVVTELADARPARWRLQRARPRRRHRLRRALDAVARAERSFLAMCVGRGELGHRYLVRLTDDHLTSAPLREARDWLKAHFDSPLAGLESEEPTLAALVTDVVALADEEPSTTPFCA